MAHEVEDLSLWCDSDAFRPVLMHSVRWLDWDLDFDLAAAMSFRSGELSHEDWLSARARGFEYCAVIEEGSAVARAAVWRYSEERWEVAAVWTRGDRRNRGMAKSTVSFATASILDAGRLATLHAQPTNSAMLRAATSVGFRIRDAERLAGEVES